MWRKKIVKGRALETVREQSRTDGKTQSESKPNDREIKTNRKQVGVTELLHSLVSQSERGKKKNIST